MIWKSWLGCGADAAAGSPQTQVGVQGCGAHLDGIEQLWDGYAANDGKDDVTGERDAPVEGVCTGMLLMRLSE